MKTIHYNHAIPGGNTQESTKIQLDVNQLSSAALVPYIYVKTGFFSTGTLAAATVAVLLGVLLPTTASATLFDPLISITGSAEFDSIGSPTAPQGGATQSGTLTRIMGGTTTITTLSGDTVAGADPLTGTLTDNGDGFGIAFNASGISTGGTSAINNLFGDLSLSIANNSADIFTVNLKITFSNAVDAIFNQSSTASDIAFAQAEINLLNGVQNVFFADTTSDTFNGNEKFVYPDNTNQASGSGGAISASGSMILPFILNPGQVITLGDISSSEVRAFGGTFGSGNFSTVVSALLTVDSVEKQQTTPPTPTVPEPETLFILAIGLALFRLANRRSQSFSFR